LHDLDVGVGQRQDRLLDQGRAIRVVDEMLHRFVEHDAGPEGALEHRARCLAGPEAGDARPAAEAADCVLDGAGEPLGRQLDFEDDGTLGGGGGGDLHSP
jgi:hypothetical protein